MEKPTDLPLSRMASASLVAVLLVAAVTRIHGLAFGLPALYEPDEPLFVLNAVKLVHDHTLNPGWFGHPGTTTLYALALVDLLVYGLGLLTGRWTSPATFGQTIYHDAATLWLPDRGFILVCGLLCVYLTFRVARRLYGTPTGLVAALLLAVDPLHIKYSQIVRTDVHATVFMLLCVLAAIDIARQGARASYVMAAIWLGLAIATKWPAGIIGLAIVGACLLRVRDAPDERTVQVRYCLLAGAVALIALLFASPYLLLDYPAVLRDLHDEARPYHLGATGHGFWRNAGWYVATCLTPAFGVAGMGAVVGGLALAIRQRREFALIIALFSTIFVVAICTQALIWDRWIVPVLPFLSIAAAMALVALIQAAYRVAGPVTARLATIIVAAAVLLPLLVSVEARAVERVNDTRRLSTLWLRAHVAPGSRVLAEYLALDLLNKGWHMLFPIGDGGCVDVDANVNANITYTTIDRWRGKRPVIDLGTMNPALLPACRADYAVLVDYDRYLAEEDSHRYVQELANYRRLIASGTVVATFVPIRGRVGGYKVRIVQLQHAPR